MINKLFNPVKNWFQLNTSQEHLINLFEFFFNIRRMFNGLTRNLQVKILIKIERPINFTSKLCINHNKKFN